MSIGVFTRPVGGVLENDVRGNDNALGKALNTLDATVTALAASAVTGPGSSTDNAIVRWNGTGGTAIQNSAITVDDLGRATISVGANQSALVVYGTSGQQFRVGHDTGKYLVLSVSSVGNVLYSASTGGAVHRFDKDVIIEGTTNSYGALSVAANASNLQNLTVTVTATTGLTTYTIAGGSAEEHRFSEVVNINTADGLKVQGTKVVGAQGAAVTAPTGGTVQDSEARTAINDLISRLQAHGLIA